MSESLTGEWSVRAQVDANALSVVYVVTVRTLDNDHWGGYPKPYKWRDATAHDLMLLAQMGKFVDGNYKTKPCASITE